MTTPRVDYQFFEGGIVNALHIRAWSKNALCIGWEKMSDDSVRYNRTLVLTREDNSHVSIKVGFYIVKKDDGYEICNPTEFQRKYGVVIHAQEEKAFNFLMRYRRHLIE